MVFMRTITCPLLFSVSRYLQHQMPNYVIEQQIYCYSPCYPTYLTDIHPIPGLIRQIRRIRMYISSKTDGYTPT